MHSTSELCKYKRRILQKREQKAFRKDTPCIVKRKGVDLTDVRDYKKAIEERRDAINELVSKFQNPQGQSKSSRSGSNVVTEDNRKTTGAKQETDQLIDPGGDKDGDQ